MQVIQSPILDLV